MIRPYLCPNCQTNRSRFNLIEQVVTSVKLDSKSGEIIEEFQIEEIGPLHMSYRGPKLKVQCAVCGIIEDEQMFIKQSDRKHE